METRSKNSAREVLAARFGLLLDWLYPLRCRSCKEWIEAPDDRCFCEDCERKIARISHPFCPVCGCPFVGVGDDHWCGKCLEQAPHFVTARAWACYPRKDDPDHPLRRTVQRFKYGRKISLGKPLGRLLAGGCGRYFRGLPLDGIVPVPLHVKRLRWRGFNQAAVLAREVSRSWEVPMNPFLLERVRETEAQTQLAEDDRRKNVRRAFAVRAGQSVKGKNLLLVDDVYTSGATVDECSWTLFRAGAREVHVQRPTLPTG